MAETKMQLSGEDATFGADLKHTEERTDTHACDLISRQAMIDAVDGVDWYHQNKNGEMVHGANDNDHQAWYKAEDIYKAVESVPPAQQWIPCSSEIMPKNGEEVFVYLFNGHSPYIAWFRDGKWYTEDFEVDEEDYPNKWCPLPEPYRPEGEEHG